MPSRRPWGMRAWGVAMALLLPVAAALGAPDLPAPPLLHPPIAIQGDAGFTLPGSGVVAGSGNEDDPYRIAGWTIVHSEATSAIRLNGTRAHVVIEDVTTEALDALAYAIALRNATNVTIRTSTVGHAAGGVVLVDAQAQIHRSRFEGVHQPFDVTRSSLLVAESHFGGESTRAVGLGIQGSTANAFLREGAEVVLHDDTFRGTSILFDEISGPLTVVGSTFEGRGSYLGDGFFGPRSLYACGNRFDVGDSPYAVGLMLEGGALSFLSNEVRGGAVGLSLVGATEAHLEGNRFEGQAEKAMWLVQRNVTARDNTFLGEVRVPRGGDLRQNWWGHESGPSGLGPGTGAPLVTTNVLPLYDPWLEAAPQPQIDCVARMPSWAAGS